MKKLVITGGNWTSNGNFSGYDREVGRVHFFGAQMKALGYEKYLEKRRQYIRVSGKRRT